VFSASPPPHRPFHQIHPSSSLAFLHTLQPSDLTGHTGSTCLVALVWRQPVFVPTNDFDFDDPKQEYTQCAEPPERVWIMYWRPNNIFKNPLDPHSELSLSYRNSNNFAPLIHPTCYWIYQYSQVSSL
jgi:hypothetical protein